MTTTRIRTHRLLVLGALVAAALLAGCTDDRAWPGSTTTPPGGPPTAVLASDLRQVQDCDELVDAARPALRRTVDALWSSDPTTTMPASRAMEDSAGFSSEAPTASAAPAAGQATEAADDGSVVGTNNQEQGVDEGDLVKTDGTRLVSVVDGVLRVAELDSSPQIDGTLDLRSRGATELFLRGEEALVVGTSHRGIDMTRGFVDDLGATTAPETTVPETSVPDTSVPDTSVPDTTVPETTVPETTVPETTVPESEPVPLPEPVFSVATTLTRVSLTDPAAPTVVEAVDVEGSVAATRMIDGRVRLVVRSEPVAATDVMMSTDRAAALAVVDDVDAGALVPRLAVDGEVSELGGCSDVLLAAMPAGPEPASGAGIASDTSFMAGPQTITVVTVGDTLADLQPVSVQGGAEVTYASTDALFVAASAWDADGGRTDVHRFALGGEGPAEYTGSGSAPGHLLNQFSLSELDGALRVVTTVEAPFEQPVTTFVPGDADEPMPDIAIAPRAGGTSGRLTILDTDGALEEVGHVDDLGPGETVRSVRFIGDLGYVVTFRQTDPLYALDLSDPRAPRVLGELKIPGFSEYLHPLGDGLLIGVGREVDPESLLDQGLKISLFDVSDPAAMAEIDRIVLADAWSPVSNDHHAFMWDPDRSQAVLPLDRTCVTALRGPAPTVTSEVAGCDSRGAALVVEVEEGRLVTRGEWSHESAFGAIAPLRTVVVGSDLWSVSIAGLGRTNADDPSAVELQPF
ncbi:MAG: beta-propeller domain-containing protein [Microthrixaceae bacterium]